MTDLEMTLLCAEAMGSSIVWKDGLPYEPCSHYMRDTSDDRGQGLLLWAPLDRDAQMAALVKKFHIYQAWSDREESWETELWDYDKCIGYRAFGPDLNRANVTCVAKMQKARKP